MVVNRIALFLLALGLLGLATPAHAADGKTQEKTFFDRIDDFGKGILDGFRPVEKPSKEKETAATKNQDRSAPRKSPLGQFQEGANSSQRAGSILSDGDATTRAAESSRPGTEAGARSSANETLARPNASYRAGDGDVGAARSESATAKPVRRQPIDLASVQEPDANNTAVKQTPAMAQKMDAGEKQTPAIETVSPTSEASDMSPNAVRPLHERLSTFRQSAFSTAEQRAAASSASTTSKSVMEPSAGSPKSSTTSGVIAGAGTAPKLASRPQLAQRLAAETRDHSEATGGPTLDAPVKSPAKDTSAAEIPAKEEEPAAKASPASADDLVLFARKGPVLGVETLGPRKIAVGKESVYEVSLVNSGEVAAEDLLVFVSLPNWAEVAAADPTVGKAQTTLAATGEGVVQWEVGRMNAKGRERLALRIIPRQSKPFDLAVRWEYKPVASQAMIEVQEPKLVVQLEGPREVLYGKTESYRLKITNSGTGSAENVAIMLMPLGTGENVAASHKLGELAAGAEKNLDVELTARQAGNLTIQVQVRADNGAQAELSEDVLVRRAGLKADIEGPKVQFLGQQALYTIRVRNSGTAMAKNIRLSAALPAGAEYISGMENATHDETAGKLDWTLEKLGPEAEQTYVIRCDLGTTGMNRLEVNVVADDDLNTAAAVNTRVESVASLVMEVKDPVGPVAVGDDAVYELRVRNRGTKDAENVEVFGYFSRGIEPVAADGSPNRMLPGQVVFLPIPAIAPGAETVLTVRGRADVAGNHVFRAEAHCKSLGTRIIREATNLYYADTPPGQQLARETAADRSGVDAVAAPARGAVSEEAGPRQAEHPSQAEVTPNIPRK